MDTSKEYIEMCRNEWIQECRGKDKWEDGDFYTDNILINHPDGFGVHESQTDEPYEMYHPIWLPRQDQLQEIMTWDYSSHKDFHTFYLIHNFYNFIGIKEIEPPNKNTELKSMEQLWLAFVMHEKFNKKWDGKEWVNHSETIAKEG